MQLQETPSGGPRPSELQCATAVRAGRGKRQDTDISVARRTHARPPPAPARCLAPGPRKPGSHSCDLAVLRLFCKWDPAVRERLRWAPSPSERRPRETPSGRSRGHGLGLCAAERCPWRRCDDGCGTNASPGVRPLPAPLSATPAFSQPLSPLGCLPRARFPLPETLYPSSVVLFSAPHPPSCGSGVSSTESLPRGG